jgi:hypothetical protein
VRRIIVACLLIVSAGAANANTMCFSQIIGAVIGAVLGAQIGDGNGQVVAGAVGAVVGDEAGRNWCNRNRPPQQQEFYVYTNPGGYATGGPSRPQVVTMYAPPCDENYYNGEYNPNAAKYFCQGQRVRAWQEQQRLEREAYERGLRGQ